MKPPNRPPEPARSPSPGTPSIRWLLAAALATAALWTALGTDARPDPSGRGWSGDFRSYYLPNAEYAGARLAAGELPLWSPHHGAGGPFLATLQVGALYPPNWLHALLPAQTAFLLLAFLHLAGAVLAAGALAGALGAGSTGAVFAGVAYATSLQLVGSVWSPPVLYAAAWAPAILWSVDRVVDAPSPRRAVLLAGCTGLALLTGWPYSIAMTLLAAGVYAAAALALRGVAERRPPWRAAAALAIGGLAGALLAGPQLLASFELAARSCRAVGSLVEAQALGGNVNRPYDPGQFAAGLVRPGGNDGVPGLPALVLALLAVGLAGPGRGRAAALLAVGALGLAASFPNHTPVYGWLRELPLLGDFRFPFRYRLLPTLALAVLGGVGLGRLQARLGPRAALAWGSAALVLQLAAGSLPVLARVLPFARSWPEARPLAEELRTEAQLMGPGPALDRIYWAGRADRLRAAGDVHAVHDLEPLSLARTAELLTFFETGRPLRLLTLPGSGGGDAIAPPFFGYLVLPDEPDRARLLDLLSVRTLVSDDPPEWLERRYRRRSPDDAPLAVFENPHALPRAYRVARARREPAGLRRALGVLVSPGFDPRREVLLPEPPAGLTGGKPGRVEVLEYAPERIRLRSSGEGPGVVVVTDAYYPGWEARVDGEPAPVLRANLAFRGVAVGPGEHEIELRYRPSAFRRAGALALVVTALGAWLVWRNPGGSRAALRRS